MAVALALGLSMNDKSISWIGCAIDRVVEYCDFESPRRPSVLAELHFKHSWIFCLNAICDQRGMSVVASATTEFNQNEVICCVWSTVQNLLSLLGIFFPHNLLNYYNYILQEYHYNI